MKKNILIIISVLIGIAILIGIQSSISSKKMPKLNTTSTSSTSNTANNSNSKKENIKSNTNTNTNTKKDEGPEVKISDIELSPVIHQPDSIGAVYITATYKNNSQKPIVGYKLTMLLKDSNKKTYLTNYDTVMPGEYSPEFKSFGPKTLDKNDIDFLYEEITYLDKNNKRTSYKYDYKLGTYSKLY